MLAFLVAVHAGEVEVGPGGGQPVVGGLDRLAGDLDRALGPEVLNVAVVTARHRALAVGALAVEELDQQVLDLGVAVDLEAELLIAVRRVGVELDRLLGLLDAVAVGGG